MTVTGIVSYTQARRVFDIEDGLDFYGEITGNLHADGAAGVATGLAKHFQEQVARTVDDAGRVVETGRAIDHAKHLDDTHDVVEATDQALDRL